MSSDSESDPDPDLIWDFGGPKLSKEERKKRPKRKKLVVRKCNWPSPTPLSKRPDILRRFKEEEPKPPPSPEDTKYRRALREQLAKLRKLVEEIAPEMLDTFPKLRPAKRLKLVDEALDDSFDEESLALCTQKIEEEFMKSHASCSPKDVPGGSVTASASSSSDVRQDDGLNSAKPSSSDETGRTTPNLLDDDNDEIFLSGVLSSF